MSKVFIIAAVASFVITSVSGVWLLPMLRKLKFGQTILDIGPRWHKNKEGTPTMGGIMFIFGVTISVLVSMIAVKSGLAVSDRPDSAVIQARLFYGLMLALAFGLLGFFDDYLKVVKKRNEGLTPNQKLAFQILFGCLYIFALYISGSRDTVLVLPFIGTLDSGILYYPFALFAILALSNAVNITDGLDGLLSSVTFVVALAYMIITVILGMQELGIMAAAMAGGCLGFLVWNFYPAKVFMGDTGSLFLSGLVIALAFGSGLPMFVVLIGVIYVIEVGSVLIQMLYFKATHGKRLFKMSPIHHHYEMSGYSEVQIVIAFTLITLLGSALAIWAVLRI